MIVVGSNLPKVEWTALRQLMKNKDIVIAQDDKGDSVVVLTTSNHIGPGPFTPDDKNRYLLLRSNPTEEL